MTLREKKIRLSSLYPQILPGQARIHCGHQTFVDEWMQMVMDFASCAAGPITYLHHRITREHVVSGLK